MTKKPNKAMNHFPSNFTETVEKLERLSEFFDEFKYSKQSRPIEILGQLHSLRRQYLDGAADEPETMKGLLVKVINLCKEAEDLRYPKDFEKRELYVYLTKNINIIK